MSNLCIHSGAVPVLEHELEQYPAPPDTDTYGAVSHVDLIQSVRKILDKYSLPVVSSQFAVQNVKREGIDILGARMFGVLNTNVMAESDSGKDHLRLSFGIRNSYDKTIAVGIVAGSTVFVCDNLCLTGEIQAVRKHTATVWNDILPMVESVVLASQKQHELDVEMKQIFMEVLVDENAGLDIIGAMAAHGYLSYTGGSNSMFAAAIGQWLKPDFEEFKERNIWSLFNACTFANKKSPVSSIMLENAKVTSFLRDRFAACQLDRVQELAVEITASREKLQREYMARRFIR